MGLEVAVKDALVVGVGDGSTGIDHAGQEREARGEGVALCDDRSEGAPIDELHGVIEFAVGAHAEVMNGDDAGVFELRG